MFDPVQLHEALDRIPSGSWSQPSTYEQTGVHDGYRIATLISGGRLLPVAEPFRFVLDRYEPVHWAFLSCIDPGGFIVTHRDGGPWRERWHVPIVTAGSFLQGDDILDLVDGVPFQVRHWERHSIDNPTGRTRIHLVIDRDITIDRPVEPFVTY